MQLLHIESCKSCSKRNRIIRTFVAERSRLKFWLSNQKDNIFSRQLAIVKVSRKAFKLSDHGGC